MIDDVPMKILQTIKEILKTRGWTQGSYTDEKGRVCLGEAMRRATIDNNVPHDFADYNRVHGYLLDEVTKESGPYYSLVSYNDWPGRTKEQVLSLVDRAIEKATP